MLKISSIVFLPLLVSSLSASQFIAKKDVNIYKAPSTSSELIKTIQAGEPIQVTKERINGYVQIIGGYIKESDLTTTVQTNDGKSAKAIVDEILAKKEIDVSYVGKIKSENVNLRKCPNTECEIISVGHKGDMLDVVAKTSDATWYKTISGSYINGKHLELEFKHPNGVQTKSSKLEENKSSLSETDATKIRELPKEIVVESFGKKEPLVIETNKNETSDDLYAHSGEIATKYPNEASIRNLTKTATPIPVKIPARYARALDFPVLNATGDVYTDYTYVWIKIKNEEFVLGNREGKITSNKFSINKEID